VTLLSRTAPARAAAIVAVLMSLSTAPAAAEGLFDFLFGGARRPAPPPSANSYSDPYGGRTSQRAGASLGDGSISCLLRAAV
jgi:hypothetical protein